MNPDVLLPSNTKLIDSYMQPVNLSQLDIKVDENGRAHNATNGKFMKLSTANVESIIDWHDYIVENAPGVNKPAVAAPVAYPEAAASEPVTVRQRMRRLLTRANNEIHLLPQTALQLAGKGIAKGVSKLNEYKERAPRRYRVGVVLGGMAAASLVMTEAYANVKYGSGGGMAKHDLLNQLTQNGHPKPQNLNNEIVSELTYHGNGSTKHAVADHLTRQARTTAHQAVLDELTFHGDTSTKHHAAQELHQHLTRTEVHGVHTEVIVEHGHGYAQELQELAAQRNIHLSGAEGWRSYLQLNSQFHGHFFIDDPSYLREAGDFGISRSGRAQWDPRVVEAFFRELEKTK